MKTRHILYIAYFCILLIAGGCSAWREIPPDGDIPGMTREEALNVLASVKTSPGLSYKCRTGTRWEVPEGPLHSPRIVRGGVLVEHEPADREVPVYTRYPVTIEEIVSMKGKQEARLFQNRERSLYRVDLWFSPPCALSEYQKVTLMETPSETEARRLVRALLTLRE